MRCQPLECPIGISVDQWLTRLHSERADLKRQVKQMVHTGRSLGGYYNRIDRIDVTIAKASAVSNGERDRG